MVSNYVGVKTRGEAFRLKAGDWKKERAYNMIRRHSHRLNLDLG